MTHVLPGADIRSYYAELGIELPAWARTEASVRCFADPDAHRRGDRDPSCSINLIHGSWHCHGCGARGGAFDAATAKGHSDRSAIELMVRYGLTARRSQRPPHRRPIATRHTTARRNGDQPRARTLNIGEADVQRCRSALKIHTSLIAQLARDRGWRYETMCELELGLDRGRITIPVRDHDGQLAGLLRYQPWPGAGQAKMRAAPGSRRLLLPHPAVETSPRVVLVEGEPDMIAARSRGLPAIAVPGVDGWQNAWLPLLARRQVIIVMDCDAQGRTAAAAIANRLSSISDARAIDLAPDRNDGYDLTDWLLDASDLRRRGHERNQPCPRRVRQAPAGRIR